ncbi:MAG: thioredoxin domain-containing protein, partial [Planctomycetaceae bacterium]|nr:thioredoxin domain-containing protein [Planctomycetaceae bacterium]
MTAHPEEPAHRNRLAEETSPYLLQHAANPVDWYPWGEEAIELARREDRPIFLSVGYSACHWCHVMERLVFENEEIAEALNRNFICIKVDREERPDLDDIYMTSLLVYFRAIGSPQGGGWPLSMFLTSDGRPFAGGTYFPPKDQDGQPGFLTVASRISGLWTEQRKAIEQNADVITAQVRRNMKPALVLEAVPLEQELISASTEALLESYDPKYGGFDFDPDQPEAPKFPVESRLALLQYSIRRLDSEQAATAAYNTLDHILTGGLRDHLGGGFHRYSTDRRWQVPHFEKMLYNQAQLADVFTEAWRRTGQQKYRRAVEETLDFVLRELTAPEGGFYSSLDAETEGVEGKYYVWSPEEVKQVLGADDAALFIKAYGLDSPSDFEPGHVLALTRPVSELAAEAGLPENDYEARLIRAGRQLLEVRSRREPLRRDDKVLTAWNGLMIAALARSGKLLDRPAYVAAAARAAEFVAGQMRDEEGRLLRSWREGQAGLNAYLDDYAFLSGLLELHLATGEQKWLNAARRLTDQQVAQFADKERGGFYFTAVHHEELLTRTRNAWDGALPSGNGMAVQNLIRLASFTGEDSYRILAEQTLAAFAPVLSKSPRSTSTLAVALGEFLDKPDFSTSGPAAKPVEKVKPAAGPAEPGQEASAAA